MKYFITICLVSLFFTANVFSQSKTITHKVAKGETINQIAQKYKVTPFDIYRLNPDAQSGLKPNSVLLIPNGSEKKITALVKTVLKATTHEVAPKETFYSIEKKYGVSDEALKKANPFLEKDGIQIGQKLVIPSNSVAVSKKTIASPEKTVYHEVLPKETKYSIAKLYGITVEELEKRNPDIIANLPVGYQLLIKGTAPKTPRVSVVTETKTEIVNPNTAVVSTKVEDYAAYQVKPKETLYSLSKMFGLSSEELQNLNPALSEGVVEGMILKVPSTIVLPKESKKAYSVLTKNSNDKKKLVLLLPFNLTKIEGDTVNSTVMRLKKDKFLNMTLDFYSGALMAIDSAKQLGITVDVSIFDSQESKNSSNVASIIKENNLGNADAIIGPFYQNNVEKTAGLVAFNQVPVISPLSKDVGDAYSNLYQTIPTTVTIRNTVFDFMRAKGGNIIAVVDKKKESIRKYIQENQKDVRFAALTETGSLNVESLKSLLVKNKTNYVVMETGNTGMIKSTMTTMLNAMALYSVQLVILEPNETLDTDEINFQNLAKLKLMYPSMTRENESPEALIFEKEYRKKNKIMPTAFATRGFDVTFDTMMRLSQGKTYQETVEMMATEQVDNKFEYYRKEGGGYTNKGVYVLYYDTDLTIKEAN